MPPQNEEHRLVAVRKQKIAAMRQEGVEPYPLRTYASRTFKQAKDLFERTETRQANKARTEIMGVQGSVVATTSILHNLVSVVIKLSDDELLQVDFRRRILKQDFKQRFILAVLLEPDDYIHVEGRFFRPSGNRLALEVTDFVFTKETLQRKKFADVWMDEISMDPASLKADPVESLQKATELLEKERKERKVGAQTIKISVAGRIVSVRNFGKMAFLMLSSNGERLQVQLRKDRLDDRFDLLLKWLDMGDFLRARGPMFRTRQGEVTLEANEATILGKAIKPLPEKWAGLQDIEARRRQPYLALISQPEAMQTAISRARVTAEIRTFMTEKRFTELETNILTSVAAGAVAHPFKTQWRRGNVGLYLRIATELALKKALVGGFERVYEIGKVFRNEGADKDHSPEFTTMEAYQAFASYQEMMKLTETLMARLAMLVNGTTELTLPSGKKIDLKPPWKRLDLHAALMEHADVDFNDMHSDRDVLVGHMVKIGAINRDNEFMRHKASWGRLIDKLISDRVEPTLQKPCFLVDYPAETTPFAKIKKRTKTTVERAEAFIGGMEIANMFTELNDPVAQRERMMEQERIRKEFKNEEADRLDKDFLNAMDYCMPPAGGVGIGIDRIVMLLTGTEDIGDVLLFPNLYRKEEEQD